MRPGTPRHTLLDFNSLRERSCWGSIVDLLSLATSSSLDETDCHSLAIRFAPNLAGRCQVCIFALNSDAMNPEARCRVGRLCFEGSKSRNRLSETLA